MRITIHDNDFSGSLHQLANVLYEIFRYEERFPEENELSLLEKYIEPLWFSLHNIGNIMSWNKNSVCFTESPMSLFIPHIEFVDYLDIPDWDNGESVYIPMIKDAEIIVR